MSLTINTTKLKELVQRSVKAVSNNSILPVTGLMSISVEDGTLTLLTTDRVNYLYVSEPVDSEDMQITVSADAFAKLVARLTSESVELRVEDSSLVVKANGTYRIEIPMDENGAVKFSHPYKCENWLYEGVMPLGDVKTVIGALKPSLAVTEDVPMYTQYYLGDIAVATNEITVASAPLNGGNGLFEPAKLVSAKTLELLSLFHDDTIFYTMYEDNVIKFTSSDCELFTTCQDVESYPINTIRKFIDMQFGSVCVLPKNELLQTLDRLALFVGAYDNNMVTMDFTEDGLVISSLLSTGVETVPFVRTDNFTEFSCNIDVQLLQTHVKAQTGDTVELWYGVDNCVNLKSGGISVVIALSK